MDRFFIVFGRIGETSVTYGYFKSLDGARACMQKNAYSFAAKGFTIETGEPALSFNERAEIVILQGQEYYGYIRIREAALSE